MYFATRTYIEGLVSTLSKRTKIKFVEGRGFGVNLKEKIFRYDVHILKTATIDEVKGILLHEVGHLNYTTNGKPSKIQEKYPQISAIYNICEDFRIENRMIKAWGRFAKDPIYAAHEFAIYANFNNKSKIVEISDYKKFQVILINRLLEFDFILREGFRGEITPYLSYINSEIGPEIRDRFSHEEYVKIMKVILTAKNTLEIRDFVDSFIFPRIKDLLKEEKDQAEEFHGMIKELGKKIEKLFKTSADMLEMVKGIGPAEHRNFNGELPEDDELRRIYSIPIYNLTSRLSAILQEKSTIKYAGSYKRGKLINKNIFKVRTQEKRLYSKRNHPDTPVYTVTFVMDESGSMEGQPYNDIYSGAFIIDEAAKKLKFKRNYIGFSDTTTSYKKLSRTMFGGGNNEDRMIKAVKKALDLDDENIVFILTDGGCSHNPSEIIEWLEKAGVRIFPIGINIDNKPGFKHYYKNPIFIENFDELSTVMISAMRELIHR